MLENSSPDRWVDVASPVEANEMEPGSALPRAIRSCTLRIPVSGAVTSTLEMVVSTVTGARSRAES
jgi:hypothetical protein